MRDILSTQIQYAENLDPVTKHALMKHSQATLDRLAHIEFTLMFKGTASRYDLISRFGTASAQATKDFALYRKTAPENMLYDSKMRVNYRGKNFKPMFHFDIEKVLSSLTLGFGDGFGRRIVSFDNAVEGSISLVKPSIDILAKICEAIYLKAPLKIKYASTQGVESEEEKWRVIVPHTVVNSTLKWHVRSYDRKSGEFRDFILTRIIEAEVLFPNEYQEIMPTSRETVYYDCDWNRYVTLELIPHPTIKNDEFVRLDYDIDSETGCRLVTLRASIAPYFLRAWNVDCSKKVNRNAGHFHHLALRNVEVLNTIMNSNIAPGAEELEIHQPFTVNTERPKLKAIQAARKKQRDAALKVLAEVSQEKIKKVNLRLNGHV